MISVEEARTIIEDHLNHSSSAENLAFADGLVSGFYLCGLFDQAEWNQWNARIRGNQPRLVPTS